jgi:hypothetical protein
VSAEAVKRSDLHRFIVLPKRWIVERTFAWISRNRRLARNFERYARTVAAFIRIAMIRLMLKRLTRSSPLLMNPFFLDRLLGRKLFCEARASISVPSAEKYLSDNNGLTCGYLLMKFRKHLRL